MKYLQRISYSSIFAITMALSVLSGQLLSVAVAADPLPQDQVKALHDWTHWIAASCSGSNSADDPSTTSVTPGSGTPTGLTFPNLNPGAMATAVETFIKKEQPGSPLLKITNSSGDPIVGDIIVASAKNSNINPFLVVGIANQETSLGTADTPQVTEGHAVFNRKALSSQPHISIATGLWYKWDSFRASVDYKDPSNKDAAGGGDISSYLRYQYKSELNSNNLDTFVAKYDADSAAIQAVYKKNLTAWMKEMADIANKSPGTVTTATKPTIVIDPGHSGKDIQDTDPQTGLLDHDYPNYPEINEVYEVAQKVEKKLQTDGYNVIMTKSSANDSVSFRERANIANTADADLAISIHDTHDTSWQDMKGSSGAGGEVYVQKVGDYRQNKSGDGRGNQKVTFTDAAVAKKSQQYGTIFAQQRSNDEGHSVKVTSISFDGRSGLPDGDIPMVMLFAKVPWVYNEVGADGSSQLSETHLQDYAQGLVDGVEKSVPTNANGGDNGTDTSATSSCQCATSTFDTTASLSGSSNREQVYNYFIGKGLGPVQAAAIVGNLGQESHWNPKSPGGYIAQWGGAFLTALENFANKKNVDVGALGTQLDFIWEGLTNGPLAGDFDESNVLKNMKSTNDVAQATIYFMGTASVGGNISGYENPGDPQQQNRIDFAQAALKDFGNGSGAGSSVGSGSGSCSNSLSPQCDNATGNATILCEAEKYDPVNYVWGGGHAGGTAFHKACPTIKANDTACGLDCSGLVSVAVYDAFQGDGTISWDTNSLRADSSHWKQISYSDLQPGDVIEPDPGHVEIIDSVNGSNMKTFGAHTDSYAQPEQVGPASYTNTAGYLYYRYIGPGSSG